MSESESPFDRLAKAQPEWRKQPRQVVSYTKDPAPPATPARLEMVESPESGRRADDGAGGNPPDNTMSIWVSDGGQKKLVKFYYEPEEEED